MPSIHGSGHPALYAIGAAVLFGASTPFAKFLLSEISPLPFAAFLYLGSGLGILPFFLARKKMGKEAGLRRTDLPWLLSAIATGGMLAPVVLLYGLSSTPASTTSLLLNLEVVATALFAWFMFREEITLRVGGAISLLVSGSVLLTWTGGTVLGFSAGAFAIIGATVLWGLDNNLTCVISGKDPAMIAALKGFLGGGVLLLVALFTTSSFPTIFTVLLALVLGFLSYGLSTILFIYSLRNLGSTRTSTYFSAAPFIGALTSLFVFREVPSVFFLLSLLLMLGGILLLVRETHTHVHRHYRVVHEHRHRHDEPHHQHEDGPEETHTHQHVHEGDVHAHPHTPDMHHRHEK